jgi:hypothetical protein
LEQHVSSLAVPDPAGQQRTGADTRSVCVVIPIPNDPPWELFDAIPSHIPIIVSDDSDGKLAPAPRDNVFYYDYAAQERYAGKHYAAMPHKSAASRNIGHYIAYREGFDVIIALDYDCGTRAGWLDAHLDALVKAVEAPAVQPIVDNGWVNSIAQTYADGTPVYARGYPYELRATELAATTSTTATGEIKLNMGVWDRTLDLNGVDKLYGGEPRWPGTGEQTSIALGHLPLCGMNTAFAAELTPAYYFLPDVWVDRWQLSRHDDIWGGYVLKKLMNVRGDLVSFGRPVVEHTKQTKLERVVVLEQWMHLMSMPFYDIVDAAAAEVQPGEYTEMFAHFVEAYLREVECSPAPVHYRGVYRELGDWMLRWSKAFA